MFSARVFLLLALLSLESVYSSLAAEPVTIANLLEDPDFYHARVITLQGTAHQVQIVTQSETVLPPVNPPGSSRTLGIKCFLVHPAYTFVLGDDSGFLQVAVRTPHPERCLNEMPPLKQPEVSEGDKVVIDAQITVAHSYSGGSDKKTLDVLAVRIRRLGN